MRKGISGVIYKGKKPELDYGNFNDKFIGERVNTENDKYSIQFDGILLNYNKPQNQEERFKCISDLYELHGPDIVNYLKGAFNLVIYDKEKQSILIANDALANRPFYYYAYGDIIIYAASYYDMLSLLHDKEIKNLTYNVTAIESMICKGMLQGKETYLNEVEYLGAFEYMIVDLKQNEHMVISYYPQEEQRAYSENDAVMRFEALFSLAVESEFRKNKEYGYNNLVTLSGGMDSRSTILEAFKKGYGKDNILSFNYSQEQSLDHRVSKEIACDLSIDYIHYPMDAACFIKKIDNVMDCNECQQSCIGSTGARTLSTIVDLKSYGIIHTGLCGGELLGDLLEQKSPKKNKKMPTIVRLGLIKAELCNNINEYFDNVRGCYNFARMFDRNCEILSPFLDKDLVTFVLSLDPKLLFRRKLYRTWMRKYLPNNYETTFFCGPIDISPIKEYIKKGYLYIIKKVRKRKTTIREMNPIDYWVNTHSEIQSFLLEKYEKGIENIKSIENKKISNDIINGWNTGGWIKRFYVLTAIRALQDIYKYNLEVK